MKPLALLLRKGDPNKFGVVKIAIKTLMEKTKKKKFYFFPWKQSVKKKVVLIFVNSFMPHSALASCLLTCFRAARIKNNCGSPNLAP